MRIEEIIKKIESIRSRIEEGFENRLIDFDRIESDLDLILPELENLKKEKEPLSEYQPGRYSNPAFGLRPRRNVMIPENYR